MIKYKNLSITEIPITDIEKVAIVNLNGLTMNEWYNKQSVKPKYMLNASLWDSKGAIGTIYKNGVLVRNSGNGYGIGVANDGVFFGNPWDKKWIDYITGYPALIKNGQRLNDKVNDSYVQNSKNKRSVVAMNKDRLCLITGEGLTVAGLTTQLYEYCITDAINLDGGGSSRMLIDGIAVNNPTDNRRCPNAIAVYMKNKSSEGDKMKYDVCLDAGHGIDTFGKCSPDKSYYEYEFNRDVTNKIKSHLERCGLNVFLTAPTQNDVLLSERCKLANNSGAKIVVSIHSNASGDDWSNVNYWMAGICAKGGNAEKLGKAIEAESIPKLGLKSNGVSVQNWAMVRDTKAPAVLIEHGFHTNKEHLEKLKTQEYRKLIAECDAKGICRHLGVKWVDDVTAPNVPSEKPWYDEDLKWAKDNGIMDGTRPNDTVTRAECVAMIHRALKLINK